MSGTQTGELAAMAAALLWTLSALAWTAAGRRLGALSVSFLRLLITCVFLVAYGQVVRGLPLPTDAGAETWLVMGLSGLTGFFVADLLWFKSLVLIGPRLSLLMQSLMPPMTAVISWVFLGDVLDADDWLGMAVTLAGVVWVTLEKPNGTSEARRSRRFRQGVLLSVGAAAAAAVATVLSREGIGQYDAAAATFIRVLGGVVGYLPLVTLMRRWPSVFWAARQGKAMLIVVFGSVVGPFLGVVFYLIALRHCHAGVVATIVSTTPVLILPFVVFLYREKVSVRAAAGAVISLLGVAMLVL